VCVVRRDRREAGPVVWDVAPFSDGNGRLGRAIWYFRSKNSNCVDLGFLHGFYLQTLNKYGTDVEKFLIHPDLARTAKVEWPDVDLDN
jgi:hypothetical protein